MVDRPNDGSDPDIRIGSDRVETERRFQWTEREGPVRTRVRELRSSVRALRTTVDRRVGISESYAGFFVGELEELAEALEMALAASETLDDPGKRVEALTRQSLVSWETRLARGHEKLKRERSGAADGAPAGSSTSVGGRDDARRG